jgi:cytochrome o ubiquinol oxidase subunit 2
MAGMQTRLHLMAHEAGTYLGQNQQFSGSGYAEMNFKAIATSREDFEAWVQKIRRSGESLDTARYEKLAAPSADHPVAHYRLARSDLFDSIVSQFKTPPGAKNEAVGRGSAALSVQTGALEKP